MRHRATAPLIAAACLLALPGCAWLLGPLAGSSVGGGNVVTVTGPVRSDEEAARAAVRNAVPALESYFTVRGTYAGASLGALRGYDDAVGDVAVFPSADGTTYCLEATVGAATFHRRGLASGIEPGGC